MKKGIHQLRPYQQDIKRRVVAAWDSHRSVMVQMPTGTGKTHVLAAIIREVADEGVWIIAHRRELVEQIEETVARYGMRTASGRVRVMSIQWLSRHWDDMDGRRPGLIVIDEAHHALAATYKELWSRHPEARKLGMTATPCRLNRMGFTDLFEVLIASDGIADFIRQGWLSAFDYVSIRPDSEDQRLVDSLSKRGADGDFQEVLLLPSGGDTSYTGLMVEGDTLWVSYYSSHETPNASVYLARIPLSVLGIK